MTNIGKAVGLVFIMQVGPSSKDRNWRPRIHWPHDLIHVRALQSYMLSPPVSLQVFSGLILHGLRAIADSGGITEYFDGRFFLLNC